MRISDWSSDVCSSDLTAPSRLSNLKRSTDRASSPARHSPRRVFLCQSLQLRPSLTLTGSNDPVNPDLVRKKIMARTARKNDIPTFRSIAGGILSAPMFRKRVEKKKVGRASYTRKVKHRRPDERRVGKARGSTGR